MPALSSESTNKRPPRTGLALAIAALFACVCGYANAQYRPPTTITIVPSGTSPLPAGVCTTQQNFLICVSEDPIDLTRTSRPVTIIWDIASTSTGWTFVKNQGIKFKKGTWTITKSDAEYTATQKKKDGVIYKYTINVTNGTGTPLSWDPTIMN
jgi:hypothetical protein